MTTRLLLAALATSMPCAASATATTGNLYPLGPQPNWMVGSQTLITQPQIGVWQVELPQTALSLAALKWAMSWQCPVPGSEIASVSWGSLRWAPPSALAEEVVTEAGTEFHLPDVYLPQSPAPGAQYDVQLPSGRCSATLQIRQGQDVAQHKRIYWIGNPSVMIRDIATPQVRIRTLGGQLFTASRNVFRLDWSASDNFGSDGITGHRVTVGGYPRWAQGVGEGDFSADIDLTGIPDGMHAVRVVVDGDGTGSGVAETSIEIDRTAPHASAPTVVSGTDPTVFEFAWSAGDTGSGVTSSQLEINSATDGSGNGTWTPVGQSLAGPGAKRQIAAIAGFSDGVHAIRVRVVDLAGNVGYSAPADIAIDSTPPTVDVGPIPPGHIRSLPLTLTLGDNLATRWGLGTTTIEGNSAPDGSATGSWIALRPPEVLSPGVHRLTIDLAPLTDGRHQVRVRTRNGGTVGVTLAMTREFTIDVDQTSPDLTDVAFRPHAGGRVAVSWIASDRRSGVATARVAWHDGVTWRTLQDVAATDGAGSTVVETTQLPEGTQRLRLTVLDRAGNSSTIAVEGSVEVDHTPPSITGLRVSGPPWTVSWTLPVLGPRDTCPTKIALHGPHTGGAWRDVAEAPAVVGAHSLLLPLDGYSPGAYRVRVTACDQAGNSSAVETGGVLIGATGGEVTAAPAYRLELAAPGHRVAMVDDQRRYTARIMFGRSVVLAGRLLDAGDVPRPGVWLRLDVKGTSVRVRTGTDGRFRTTIAPAQSGFVRATLDAAGPLSPDAMSAQVRIVVTPTVTFRASRHTAVALGAPIVFSGRVGPSPRRLGLTVAKTVILEWRDPVRKAWRPVVNQSLSPDGRFVIRWRFQAGGLRIPMRVRVPSELGWGLEQRISPTIVISVR